MPRSLAAFVLLLSFAGPLVALADPVPPPELLDAVAPTAETARYATLAEVLGRHLRGAKMVAIRQDTRLQVIDLAAMTARDLADFDDYAAHAGDPDYAADVMMPILSRPYISPDGRQVLIAGDGSAARIDLARGGRLPVLPGRAVYEPQWWADPATGEACILFMDDNQDRTWPIDAGLFGTYLYRPRADAIEKLTDFPCDGGLSRDGRFIADAVGHAMLRDLAAHQTYVLARGDIACNASIAPDGSYRLMHLFWPHRYFGIRDHYDRVLWRIHHPADVTEWDNPRWSNLADFCTAIVDTRDGRFIAVIRISTRQMAVLRDLGPDWSVPHLWLAAGQKSRPIPDSPLAHLKLVRHADLYERAAHAERFTPILRELAEADDPEARRVEAAFRDYVDRSLAEAAATDDLERAGAILAGLSEQFAGHPCAERADALLADERYREGTRAQAALKQLQALAMSLASRKAALIGNAPAEPPADDPDAATLEQMGQLVEQIGARWPGTSADKQALAIAYALSLPNLLHDPPDPAPGPVTVAATVLAVSSVPPEAQLQAYRNWVIVVKYRVDQVITGQPVSGELLVAHRLVVDGRKTAAASIRVGDRRTIACDSLSSRPEAARVARADELDDGSLPLMIELER